MYARNKYSVNTGCNTDRYATIVEQECHVQLKYLRQFYLGDEVIGSDVSGQIVCRRAVLLQTEGGREGVVALLVDAVGRRGGGDPVGVGGELRPQRNRGVHGVGGGDAGVSHSPVGISGSVSYTLAGGSGRICV